MWRDVVDALLGLMSIGLGLGSLILFCTGHHDAGIFSIGMACWVWLLMTGTSI